MGNESTDGAIIVLNNRNPNKDLWVDATPQGWSDWSTNTLVNAFDNNPATQVCGDGRVWMEAPARSYSV